MLTYRIEVKTRGVEKYAQYEIPIPAIANHELSQQGAAHLNI
jgi:hypothetical protein